jgi:hypothetical protein
MLSLIFTSLILAVFLPTSAIPPEVSLAQGGTVSALNIISILVLYVTIQLSLVLLQYAVRTAYRLKLSLFPTSKG